MTDVATTLKAAERAAQEGLAAAMGESGDDDVGLQITGVEVLAFLAAQAVIPIITNFVSAELHDRYGSVRNRKDAESARNALRDAVPSGRPARDPEEVRRHVVVVLVGEGLAPEVAEAAARRAHEAVVAGLGPGG
jgi:hypothetical protein